MRFLHCSDLHLGRKPTGSTFSNYSVERYEDYFKAFEYIVDFSIQNEIEVFLIAGDLFDKRELSPDVLERTEKILEKLRKANIPTLCTEGNHDRAFGASNEKSWLEYLSSKGLINLLRPFTGKDGSIDFPTWNGKRGGWMEINGVRFYGLGYQGFSFPQYLKKLREKLDDSAENVVLAHTAIGNPEIVAGCVSVEDIETISDKCIYIAGGHIHTKRVYENLNFFVPGAPEYWDIKEKGEKGFFIYDTIKKAATFHNSFKRKKIDVSIKVKNDKENRILHKIHEAFEKHPIERGCIYSVEIKVPFGLFVDLDTTSIEEEIERMGALKGYVSIDALNLFDKESDEEMETFSEVEMVEEDVIKNDPFLASYAEDIVRALNRLKDVHDKNWEESFSMLDELFSIISSKSRNGKDANR